MYTTEVNIHHGYIIHHNDKSTASNQKTFEKIKKNTVENVQMFYGYVLDKLKH